MVIMIMTVVNHSSHLLHLQVNHLPSYFLGRFSRSVLVSVCDHCENARLDQRQSQGSCVSGAEAQAMVLILCESEDVPLEPFPSSDQSEFLIVASSSCQVNLLSNPGVSCPVTHPTCCGLADWHPWPLAGSHRVTYLACLCGLYPLHRLLHPVC